MIEHVFIKNYKAFERENIPLDKHTLLIGSNHSGKTTVLEALDLFFNDVLVHPFIRDLNKDVVIEIHIDEERYRKVFSPPNYHLNYTKCLGDMFQINDLQYLYVPADIDNASLLNDILSINLSIKLSPSEQGHVVKVFDYIDGTLGNTDYPLFGYRTKVRMNIRETLSFSPEEYGRILSNITHPQLILGIDNVEDNFVLKHLHDITKYTYQTIYSTNDETIVKHHDYYVSALYKGNQIDDFDTIKKRLNTKQTTTYVLVEGKYDVNWYERAITLLGLDDTHTVIPCGGFGNITFVKQQLDKEGYRTVVITDGDAGGENALSKDVIELYADIDYVNQKFHTSFRRMPDNKKQLFRTIGLKDDVVKNILSRWAKKHLTLDHPFVREVKHHISQI